MKYLSYHIEQYTKLKLWRNFGEMHTTRIVFVANISRFLANVTGLYMKLYKGLVNMVSF